VRPTYVNRTAFVSPGTYTITITITNTSDKWVFQS